MKKLITTLVGLSSLLGNLFAQVAPQEARLVRLDGTVNFRDIGGYKTSDGKTVKWGKLYRADALDKLSDTDKVNLTDRKIAYVIDFRGNEEALKAPDLLPEQINYVRLPAGSSNDSMKSLFAEIKDGKKSMEKFYSNTNALVPRYKPFFQQLLSLPDSSALVYHCTAGKDRTGIATALVLYTLGVPKEQIIEDYLSTNYYRKDANEASIQHMMQMGLSKEAATDIMGVQQSYLEATFAAIEQEYGSMQKFLAEGLGISDVEIARLKDAFVN
ncbi:tyrosine-protein phosphatase [Sphingobacterium oryzagri]|uniref:Tyrosine-protein phosphatase n=1 Tax=Sphingobacterium oryzagri TaxID=3025669 RepID=A0ABY7WJ72_9SPHI|nr:tyrosine-protein phosphatase [Sphingobacterium sp. KACC 22765]WDF68649.1 tyrosine-protein phosphatase [Sphingobacterium sp. KACC 22765]